MIADIRDARRDLALEADVCVVGGGIAGARVAQALADAGVTTVLLEEGGDPAPARSELQARARRLRHRGFLASLDRGIAVLAGAHLGGSFDSSGGELWRVPGELLDGWARATGAAWLAAERMGPAYDELEATLVAAPAPPGAGADALERGAGELGWAVHRPPRADRLADGGGDAIPDGARRSVRRGLLGPAAAAGVAVFHHARVDRVSHDDRRVDGVQGAVIDRGHVDGRFRVRAPALVMAAGALCSPGILQRSRVPDPRRLLGAGLRLQPTAAAVGLFDEPLPGSAGLAVTEFADGLGRDPGGVLLRTGRLAPGLLAGMLPWTGDDLERELADGARRVTVTVTARDRRPGRCVPTADGAAPSLKYEPSPGTRRALRCGLERAAEWLLAAGAREVWTSHATPLRIGSVDELRALRRASYLPCAVALLSTSPLGGCAPGERPRRAAVDPDGRLHHLGGVYVADGSIVPDAPGVPPGPTIAVAAAHVASIVIADLGSAGA